MEIKQKLPSFPLTKLQQNQKYYSKTEIILLTKSWINKGTNFSSQRVLYPNNHAVNSFSPLSH